MHLKKSTAVVALALLSLSPLFGGSIESDLAKLKSQRELAIAKYTVEIDRQYVKELNKLQEKALGAKDLDGAIAVKAELKNFNVMMPVSSFATKEDIIKNLVGKSYRYKGNNFDGINVIQEHGKWSQDSLKSWKVTGSRELTCICWDGKNTIVFKMSEDWKTGTADTKKSTYADAAGRTLALVVKTDEAEATKVEAPASFGDSNSELFGRKAK